jgi:ribosomal-protein-alanine N-acetyltransferase
MIESVSAADSPALACLHARAFSKAWGAEAIAKILNNPTTIGFAARNERLLGFVLAWAAAGDAELLTIAVAPGARRSGVASQLLCAALAAALARGAAAMHLDVAADNAAACALYLKHGFAEVGRRRGYYATEQGGFDAIVMRRALVG